MATAVLNVSYLDPVISEKQSHFLKPGPIPAKIIQKRVGTRPSFFCPLMIHPVFLLHLLISVPLTGRVRSGWNFTGSFSRFPGFSGPEVEVAEPQLAG
jgi:hypothetical protein